LIERKRRVERIKAVKTIQNNIRAWFELQTWQWFKLYGKASIGTRVSMIHIFVGQTFDLIGQN
jgi:hypothetical protein